MDYIYKQIKDNNEKNIKYHCSIVIVGDGESK